MEKSSSGDEEAPFLPSPDREPAEKTTSLTTCLVSSALAFSVVINLFAFATWQFQDLDAICSLYTSQASQSAPLHFPKHELFNSCSRSLFMSKWLVCAPAQTDMSPESPIQNDIAISYTTVQYNGSLFRGSIYRSDPSPEVDAAWLALGTQNNLAIIPESQAAEFSLDPAWLKRVPEEGGGVPVLFEFEHHLHCLNVLRMTSRWNYDYYASSNTTALFENEEDVVQAHVGHCLDIIRQHIQCTADTGVFGQRWVDSIQGPFVDFNTPHKCKNFENLRDWVSAHAVPDGEVVRLSLREGETALAELQ